MMTEVTKELLLHVEINLCAVIPLIVIAHQVKKSVNQEAAQRSFSYCLCGLIAVIFDDTVWSVIDGKRFTGDYIYNYVLNAIFLSLCVSISLFWLVFVMRRLGITINKILCIILCLPAGVICILNFASIWTDWMFYISPGNVYYRGEGYFYYGLVVALYCITAIIVISYSFIKNKKNKVKRRNCINLLLFFLMPILGAIFSIPISGMPGVWPFAAISIILLYLQSQENAIIKDGLTGLNNRKTIESAFENFVSSVEDSKSLYLFMFDLNKFKNINDTYGHVEGDAALVEASKILKKTVSDTNHYLARYGGDEFLLMGYFKSLIAAQEFVKIIEKEFQKRNEKTKKEYDIETSVGFAIYQNGMQLEKLIEIADQKLYQNKSNR